MITLNGQSSITIEKGTTYVDPGATAYDNVDGDISDRIQTVNPVNTNLPGTYTITYHVLDDAGMPDDQYRTVIVVDTTPPVITLNGMSSVTIEKGTTYVDPGATAYDNGDDNISDRIQTVNPVNTNLPDTYTITYNVTDSAGLAADQVTRTVIVVDTTPPVITLNGMSSVTIEKGTTYVDPGAIAYDNGDGDISDRIQTVNPVNTNLPDTYTITYNVTDSAGLAADQVTRTVIVVDTTPPVITLNGMSSVTIEKGTTYVDPGATAYDNGDDNISDRIQTVNPVNTNLPDTYTITYNVTDSAGLAADQVTRTVTVIVNDPLVGTFYFKDVFWDKYLGAAHQLSSRPGSLSSNNGAWQQLSVVKNLMDIIL